MASLLRYTETFLITPPSPFLGRGLKPTPSLIFWLRNAGDFSTIKVKFDLTYRLLSVCFPIVRTDFYIRDKSDSITSLDRV